MSDPIPQAALGTSSGLSVPAEATPGQQARRAYYAALAASPLREGREAAAWDAAAGAAAAPLREQLAQAEADRDKYRRLASKIGDTLCGNDTHAAKVRAIWALLEAAASPAREALEGGGDG